MDRRPKDFNLLRGFVEHEKSAGVLLMKSFLNMKNYR